MYKEMYDDIFRTYCKLWMKYLDPDFPPIPEPIPNYYEPLPHVPTSVPRPP